MTLGSLHLSVSSLHEGVFRWSNGLFFLPRRSKHERSAFLYSKDIFHFCLCVISVEVVQNIFEKGFFSVSFVFSLHRNDGALIWRFLRKKRLLKLLRSLQLIYIGVNLDEKHESR